MKPAAVLYTSLFLLGMGCSSYAQRQTVTVSTETITLQLNPIVSSTLQSSSTEEKTFVFDDDKDYTNGIEKQNAATISVQSNQKWVVTVRAEQESIKGSQSQGELPVNILSVRANNGEYVKLSSQDVIISQSEGLSPQERAKKIDLSYKAEPGKVTNMDNYSVKLIFTVSSN